MSTSDNTVMIYDLQQDSSNTMECLLKTLYFLIYGIAVYVTIYKSPVRLMLGRKIQICLHLIKEDIKEVVG